MQEEAHIQRANGRDDGLLLGMAASSPQSIDLPPFYLGAPYSADTKKKRPTLRRGTITADGFTSNYRLCGTESAPMLALDLPGGPGTAQSSQWKATFAPESYRVILADWRGVGEHGPIGRLEHNCADLLINDMERLRQACCHGSTEKMVLRGGSWGAAMALAYASLYPKYVAAIVMRLPFLATARDVEWNFGTSGLALRYPEAYSEFRKLSKDGDVYKLLEAYLANLTSDDQHKVKSALAAAIIWEYQRNGEKHTLSIDEIDLGNNQWMGRLARTRIMFHYALQNFTFTDGQGILPKLTSIPHGIPIVCFAHSHDPLTAPGTLEEIQRLLPQAHFYVKNADWHWIARENERPGGYDNSFVMEGGAFACRALAQMLPKCTL